MKKIIRISIILLVLVGACAAKLIYNKARIDENSRQDTTTIAIPVAVAPVLVKTMDESYRLSGTFKANRELTLLSESQGRVLRVLTETGSRVKEGQVIAELDDEMLQSQFRLAEASLEKANRDVKKFESLAKTEAVSAQQLQEVRLAALNAEANFVTTRKALNNTKIRAPFSGVVTKRHIEKGTLLMPGAPVIDLVDISRLRFQVNLSEKEINHLAVGAPVTLKADIDPGKDYQGKVISLGVKADDARRFPVEVEVINDASLTLKAGMFGVALFDEKLGVESLVIPRKCLVGSIKSPEVYVVHNDKAELRKLLIGKVTDTEAVVISGLKEGEKVVVSGQINLEDGKKIRLVNF